MRTRVAGPILGFVAALLVGSTASFAALPQHGPTPARPAALDEGTVAAAFASLHPGGGHPRPVTNQAPLEVSPVHPWAGKMALGYDVTAESWPRLVVDPVANVARVRGEGEQPVVIQLSFDHEALADTPYLLDCAVAPSDPFTDFSRWTFTFRVGEDDYSFAGASVGGNGGHLLLPLASAPPDEVDLFAAPAHGAYVFYGCALRAAPPDGAQAGLARRAAPALAQRRAAPSPRAARRALPPHVTAAAPRVVPSPSGGPAGLPTPRAHTVLPPPLLTPTHPVSNGSSLGFADLNVSFARGAADATGATAIVDLASATSVGASSSFSVTFGDVAPNTAYVVDCAIRTRGTLAFEVTPQLPGVPAAVRTIRLDAPTRDDFLGAPVHLRVALQTDAAGDAVGMDVEVPLGDGGAHAWMLDGCTAQRA